MEHLRREEGWFLFVLVSAGLIGSVVLDVVLILVTGYMIFKISNTSNASEQALFVAERDR